MAIVKVSELSGKALDYAVAICQNVEIDSNGCPIWFDSGRIDANRVEYNPSQYWAIAGPIIEREKMEITPYGINGEWRARDFYEPSPGVPCAEQYGNSSLVAAMRCYVVSKMGESVEIPEELL